MRKDYDINEDNELTDITEEPESDEDLAFTTIDPK